MSETEVTVTIHGEPYLPLRAGDSDAWQPLKDLVRNVVQTEPDRITSGSMTHIQFNSAEVNGHRQAACFSTSSRRLADKTCRVLAGNRWFGARLVVQAVEKLPDGGQEPVFSSDQSRQTQRKALEELYGPKPGCEGRHVSRVSELIPAGVQCPIPPPFLLRRYPMNCSERMAFDHSAPIFINPSIYPHSQYERAPTPHEIRLNHTLDTLSDERRIPSDYGYPSHGHCYVTPIPQAMGRPHPFPLPLYPQDSYWHFPAPQIEPRSQVPRAAASQLQYDGPGPGPGPGPETSSYHINGNGLPVNTSNGSLAVQPRAVFVRGLPYRVGLAEVEQLFAAAGSIVRCEIQPPKKPKAKQRSAKIVYERHEAACAAVAKFNRSLFRNRCIEVKLDKEDLSHQQVDAVLLLADKIENFDVASAVVVSSSQRSSLTSSLTERDPPVVVDGAVVVKQRSSTSSTSKDPIIADGSGEVDYNGNGFDKR
ncbi:hypothetical protein MMC25_002814 [Agyrium rufum]|nr:hypothetical protein [Agyrium rufum]